MTAKVPCAICHRMKPLTTIRFEWKHTPAMLLPVCRDCRRAAAIAAWLDSMSAAIAGAVIAAVSLVATCCLIMGSADLSCAIHCAFWLTVLMFLSLAFILSRESFHTAAYDWFDRQVRAWMLRYRVIHLVDTDHGW
jgi:hypothetical protein